MKLLKYILPLLITVPSLGHSGNFGNSLNDGDWFEDNGYRLVQVIMGDEVVNGCWTNLKEVREYSEEKLRSIGLEVLDKIKEPDRLPHLIFLVTAYGGKNVGSCMGHAEGILYYRIEAGLTNKRTVLGVINIKEVTFFGSEKKFNDGMIELVSRMFRDTDN